MPRGEGDLKTHKKIIVIVSILRVIGFIISAKYRIWEPKDAKQRREEKIKAEKIQSEKKLEALLQKDAEMQYREFAVLLSMKYKIDEDKVFDMLVARVSPWICDVGCS